MQNLFISLTSVSGDCSTLHFDLRAPTPLHSVHHLSFAQWYSRQRKCWLWRESLLQWVRAVWVLYVRERKKLGEGAEWVGSEKSGREEMDAQQCVC